jgi:membrane protease YdiL (CAAX protease family)
LQPSSTHSRVPRLLQLGLFLCGVVWLFAAQAAASRAAQGITGRLHLDLLESPLEQFFRLFLLLFGYTALSWIATRNGDARAANALPQRATARHEFSRGAALGWAMLLLAVFPMMLAGSLHPVLSLAPRTWGLTLLSLVTLALSTLALEVAFRGFLYTRLIAAIGPSSATFFLALFYALLFSSRPNGTALSVAVTFFTGILFSIAYLRTHALWLGWGLHFAWTAAMAVLLGLPVAGYANDTSLVSTDVSGPNWLTGGPYGPEAAAFTLLVLIAAIPVLYRITRDYAWSYTYEPIVPAGYPMDIAPPAAHTAMEKAAAAAPAPLVQILGATPTAASTLPIIEEHLRKDAAPSERPPS